MVEKNKHIQEDSIATTLKEYLKKFKNKSSYEDIRIKSIIRKRLENNPYIIHALNNINLDEQEPKSYFNKNIVPYYLMPSVQKDIMNYICYETSFTETPLYNDVMKYQQITFSILCNCSDKNIIDNDTGVPRHDLLASLIIDEFNWTNCLGFQIHLVSDQSRPVDNEFCARTLVFEQTVINSMMKAQALINNKVGV